jgi:hypothetical protein
MSDASKQTSWTKPAAAAIASKGVEVARTTPVVSSVHVCSWLRTPNVHPPYPKGGGYGLPAIRISSQIAEAEHLPDGAR